MAVDFPSDLVLDVARAAEPGSTRALEARLNGGAAADGASTLAEATKLGGRLSRAAPSRDPAEVGKEFEALLVSSMIEDMMAETGESYFGGGFAGDMWKSMMAEQIAAQVVKGADFGVASTLTDYVVRAGETVEPLRGVNDAVEGSELTRMQDATRRETDEISRDFIRDMLSSVGSVVES